MVMDALRGYVQLANGLTEVTRQRAQQAAKALLQQTGADALTSGLTGKVTDLADEIVATSKSNRQLLQAIVDERGRGRGRAARFVRSEEVDALTRRVEALERELADANDARPRRLHRRRVLHRSRARHRLRRRQPRRRRRRRRLRPRRHRPRRLRRRRRRRRRARRRRRPRRPRRRRPDVTEHPGEQFPSEVDPDVEPGYEARARRGPGSPTTTPSPAPSRRTAEAVAARHPALGSVAGGLHHVRRAAALRWKRTLRTPSRPLSK